MPFRLKILRHRTRQVKRNFILTQAMPEKQDYLRRLNSRHHTPAMPLKSGCARHNTSSCRMPPRAKGSEWRLEDDIQETATNGQAALLITARNRQITKDNGDDSAAAVCRCLYVYRWRGVAASDIDAYRGPLVMAAACRHYVITTHTSRWNRIACETYCRSRR